MFTLSTRAQGCPCAGPLGRSLELGRALQSILHNHPWPERTAGFWGEGMKDRNAFSGAVAAVCCFAVGMAAAMFLKHSKKCSSTRVKITVVRTGKVQQRVGMQN